MVKMRWKTINILNFFSISISQSREDSIEQIKNICQAHFKKPVL